MTKAKGRSKAFVSSVRALETLSEWSEKKAVLEQLRMFYGL